MNSPWKRAWITLCLVAGCAQPTARQCTINSDCKAGAYCNKSGFCEVDCRANTDCASLICETALGRCQSPPDAAPLRDLGGSVDFATADLAPPDDLTDESDLGTTRDASVPADLANADQTAPPDATRGLDLRPIFDFSTPRDRNADLKSSADLAIPEDLAISLDQSFSSDLAISVDLRSPADLELLPDLTAPPDLVTPLLSYGDVCAVNSQCKPLVFGAFKGMGICSSNPSAVGDHECAGDCNGNQPNAGCMPGDLCVKANNANALCAQSDIGSKPGCNVGADCRSGACFPGYYCTRVCASAADCPAGFTCSNVGGGTRACVSVDAMPSCVSNQDCAPAGAACDANGRCLGDCRTNADCPLRHTCQSVSGVKLCVPQFSNGGGGLGAGCNSPADCRSGYCGTNNKCITPCSVLRSVGQWCAGGYGCNPIANGMGGHALGCVTAGNGSIGDACADNSNCASGLCITDGNQQTYCSRFCNDAPCTAGTPTCAPLNLVADNISLRICTR